MEKIYIIAEIGPNHNGSISLAKKMINKISKTGADAVKFQLAEPEKVYSKEAFKANYQKKNDNSKTILEMSKKLQLSKKPSEPINFRVLNMESMIYLDYQMSDTFTVGRDLKNDIILEDEFSQITNDNACFLYYSVFYGDLTKNWIKLNH